MTAPRACLIGWPAAHSRSPIIHKYWLKSFGIDGDYRIEAVKPEDFAGFVASLGERGYVGANVTLPHKEQALKVADADARARAVGAANTLWFDGGTLRATNTDVEGFLDNLDATSPGWDKATDEALVLGAGGAARAIVFGLIERGIKTIHLVNRTLPRAEELARQFGPSVQASGVGPDRSAAAAGDLAGEHDLARHEGPAAARYRLEPAARSGDRRRRRLHSARHAIADRGAQARAENRRRPRHAAAPGRARLFALVRQAARPSRRNCGRWSRRTSRGLDRKSHSRTGSSVDLV